jgi:hypothetical protein
MTILAEISGGDNFALTAVAALNRLTHPNAVKLGARLAGRFSKNKYGTPYKLIITSAPVPQPHPHPQCWRLVSRIIDSGYECKIKAGAKVNFGTQYEPDDDSKADFLGGGITKPKALRDQGARAKIEWAPAAASTLNIVGMKRERGNIPAFMVLAHELSHADRIMRGKSLLPRPGTRSGEPAQGFIAGNEALGKTAVDWEHVEMVGFSVSGYALKDPDVVTENAMREEHGLPKRINY